MRFFVSLLILLELYNSGKGKLNHVISLWWYNMYITSLSCNSDLIKHFPWYTVKLKKIIWNIYKAIICQQMLNKINNNFCFIIIKKKITKNNQLVCYEIRLLYTYKWKIFCTIFMVISSFINLLSPYVITNQWLRLPIIIYLSIKNILKHDPIFQVE